MPFTFSHPAIVLPLKHLWEQRFSTTALVIGSIVPDFEYFLRFQMSSHYSHKWPGVLWFNLPMGLFLCFLFHDIVKRPLILNLPAVLRQRLTRYNTFNWRRYFASHWLIVVCSLLIGIASHVLWDKITHGSYRFFNHVPIMQDDLDPDYHPNRIYRIIQISYSAMGLAYIAFTIWKLPPNKTIRPLPTTRPYWILLAFTASSVLGMYILYKGLEYVDWIIAIISSVLAGLTLASLLLLQHQRALAKNT